LTWTVTVTDAESPFAKLPRFQVTVPADSAPGHVDLTVTDPGGARSILPAAIEITPPNPIVANVAPASGNSNGGTPITIHGSGFAAGDRVVLGANVYPDGEPGGCTVVDGTTIQLVTAATPGGVFDAVVIDASGVEGRIALVLRRAAERGLESRGRHGDGGSASARRQLGPHGRQCHAV
jgi:hypothetical protein